MIGRNFDSEDSGAKPESPPTNKRDDECRIAKEINFDPEVFVALLKLPSTPNVPYAGDDTL